MTLGETRLLKSGASIGAIAVPGTRTGKRELAPPAVSIIIRNPRLELKKPYTTGVSVARLTPNEARAHALELIEAAARADGWYAEPGEDQRSARTDQAGLPNLGST